MQKRRIYLCKASHQVPYSERNFYNINPTDEHDIRIQLENLWRHTDITSLNPNFFPRISLKTELGEFIQECFTLKSGQYFLKLVGDHFVFIHNNQRRILKCSHSR